MLGESETIRPRIAPAATDRAVTNAEVGEHAAYMPCTVRASHETRTGDCDRADVDGRGAK